MYLASADSKKEEVPWEEAVSRRRTASVRSLEQERTAADEVMRYFTSQNVGEGERRAWAAALRKPVETALEDLRHHPRRAADLLAPVIDSALKTARHNWRERKLEAIGKWCVCLTRPKFWPWAIKALWDGDQVWAHIQEKAQWHEVPEILLIDNRTGMTLGRAQTHAHELLPGEHSLSEVGTARHSSEATQVPDHDGIQSEIASRVLVLASWRCKLIARVRGETPPHLRNALQSLCEEAEKLLDQPAPQGSHADMLDSLLAEGLVNQVSSARPRTWVIALAAMTLGATLLWAGAKEYRWHRLVTALDNEPGLKVLKQDATWGRHEIDGLRDPLARPPEELARALGISPAEVVLHFKTYLSADEPFASWRAAAQPHPVSIAH